MTTAASTRDWPMLAFESDYKAVVAILEELQSGNVDEAMEGLQELIESMCAASQREMATFLTLLMAHIIKWKTQPNLRSTSWVRTIKNSRREIAAIQETVPSVTDEVIGRWWDRCFRAALDDAETEMEQDSAVAVLTWQEVFDDEYVIPRK